MLILGVSQHTQAQNIDVKSISQMQTKGSSVNVYDADGLSKALSDEKISDITLENDILLKYGGWQKTFMEMGIRLIWIAHI